MPNTIPDTKLTRNLRAIWEILAKLEEDPDVVYNEDAWVEYYWKHSAGGSLRARTVVVALFDRALQYWPDYFQPNDLPAVSVWADLLDNYEPHLRSTKLILKAVDRVHAQGVKEPQPGHFIKAANEIRGAA